VALIGTLATLVVAVQTGKVQQNHQGDREEEPESSQGDLFDEYDEEG
jgi:hypothetical protein